MTTTTKSKPLGPRTLLIELRKAERAIQRTDLPQGTRRELQATIQALCWALGESVMAPAQLALIGVDP